MELFPLFLISPITFVVLTQHQWLKVIIFRDVITINLSAVCVPVIYLMNEPYLIFIRRSRKLHHHPGQIAFPGGFVKESESLDQAALRELKEEIGVEKESCRILERLNDITTISSKIRITPFLVLISTNKFALNHEEVEEIYFVKLALFEQTKYEEVIMPDGNVTLRYRFPGLVIWGATARIIKNSLEEILKKLKEVNQE